MGKQWQGGEREDKLSFIFYTPTSGIWQSVWLEAVPEEHVTRLQLLPDLDSRQLRLTVVTSSGGRAPCRLTVTAGDTETLSLEAETNVETVLELGAELRTWSPQQPFLYDLKVVLDSGDEVSSYFGMRKIEMRKVGDFQRIFLNNELLPFQAGPLDQARHSPDDMA